jgi:hypothetical protein
VPAKMMRRDIARLPFYCHPEAKPRDLLFFKQVR